MLDEYGLRLLAEIGVDVYLPRQAAPPTESAAGIPVAEPPSAGLDAGVLILGSAGAASRMLDDLLRAFRSVGLRAELSRAEKAAELPESRSLVVLGESLARRLGAEMPAQNHKAINWIITSEPAALAANAAAKQGLWGEIKRLSRSLRTSRSQG